MQKREHPTLARRSVLSSIASLPMAGVALAVPMTAQAETDATFALIERHRRAHAVFSAAVDACQDLLHDGPASELQAEHAAMDALLTPEPPTLVGLRALAEYMAAWDAEQDDPTAAQRAIAMIAEACRSLIPGGPLD